MVAAELLAFEAKMKADQGLRRGALCAALGISQAKWRRLVEEAGPIEDRTLELAMTGLSAVLDYNRGVEDAAKLVEAHQIWDSSDGQGVEPRKDGNRAGIAYAPAIRALRVT